MSIQLRLSHRVSRRSFLSGLGAAGTLSAFAACNSTTPSSPAVAKASPAGSTSAAPAQAGAASAGTLKGTTLDILAGTWYVPENNTQTDNLGKQLSSNTGMNVKIERLGNQMQAKIDAILETGTGADIFVCADTDIYLYGEKLSDVTGVANDIDKVWHGWYDVAKQACIVKGKWRGLMIGQAPDAWNWRPDFFTAAGVGKFPDTYDELLDAAKKLKAYGKPMGMTLGHATGDARSTNYPVLWAFGGAEFSEDGTQVTIDSPETRKAIEWYTQMYQQMPSAVLSWLDPDNNQAFLAEQVSATTNVNTIYLAGRDSKDANQQPFPRDAGNPFRGDFCVHGVVERVSLRLDSRHR